MFDKVGVDTQTNTLYKSFTKGKLYGIIALLYKYKGRRYVTGSYKSY